MTGTARIERGTSPSWAARLSRWTIVLGIYLALHSLILEKTDLQSAWAPIHMAIVGLSAACLVAAAGRAPGAAWSCVAGVGFLLTLVFAQVSSSWPLVAAGWAVLISSSLWLAFHGGSR